MKQTFLFGAPELPYGPFAVGVGIDPVEAADDALTRARRQRRLTDRGAQSPALARLYELVATGRARTVVRMPGTRAEPEQVGHEYATEETYLVAVGLASNAELARRMKGAAGDPAAARARLIKHATALARESEFDLEMVDWSEVAAEFACDEKQERPTSFSGAVGGQGGFGDGGAVTGRRVDSDVLDVLREATADGQLVRLPARRLPPKIYAKVNEVLVALGGRWKGGTTQAHVFDDDEVGIALEIVQRTGMFTKPQDFGYFPTPAALVRTMIELSDLEPGMKVLEPEAGRGDIAVPAAHIVGFDGVTVVELLDSNVRRLREAGFVDVQHADFLSIEPQPVFDRVLMNPPFSGLADVEHVQHAARFLAPEGRLVGIMAPAWQHHETRKARHFRDFAAACEAQVQDVPAGTFRDAGTEIATRLISIEAANLPWHRERPRIAERV